MTQYGFDLPSSRRIAEVVRHVERRGSRQRYDDEAFAPTDEPILCLLDGALTAASNPYNGATTVAATVLIRDNSVSSGVLSPGVFTPATYKTGTRVEHLVNRSIDLSADADTMVLARRVSGEWLIIWCDCSATTRI